MKYVVNSSVGFKWLVAEYLSDKAQKLRDNFRNAVHELLAPDIFPIEITHALTRAERQGRITPSQGGVLFADLMANPPYLVPSLPLLPRAYAVSSAMRVGVYDCL